jgi:putative redox protein
MKATVTWKEGLAFTGLAKSGIPVRLDGDLTQGGQNSGVQPMEMVALGLAGCTAMDVLSILQKKRQKITSFEVDIDAPRSADYPNVFTSAVLTLIVAGRGIQEDALMRSIELSITKYCAVNAMLEKAFPIELRYEIYEDEGKGARRLIHQGTWRQAVQEE